MFCKTEEDDCHLRCDKSVANTNHEQGIKLEGSFLLISFGCCVVCGVNGKRKASKNRKQDISTLKLQSRGSNLRLTANKYDYPEFTFAKWVHCSSLV